ncbi:O-antigen ligase family protein [Sphingobacterium sp.]|uniref:O-antigen ligase family protein n=1 Tax=Sphingobacterium sp. TaxID=341027 RepID=UPI00259086E2|nr:O-antigen ligase family protein [Sphingobacterium sp.]WET67878.1 MAG: O-antigen ligase family protein [Sphingobacterium sp.]
MIIFAVQFFVYLLWKTRGAYTNFLKNKILRIILAFIVPILFLFFVNFKKDSSIGRVFIWKTCYNLILEKPIFGHGFASFEKVYNREQGNYFRNIVKKDFAFKNEEVQLADHIEFPYNDFLEIFIEGGSIALLLYIIFICDSIIGIFKIKLRDGDSFCAIIILLSFLVQSMFWFGIKVPVFSIPLFIGLAISSKNRTSRLNRGIYYYFFLLVFSIFIVVFSINKQLQYYKFRVFINDMTSKRISTYKLGQIHFGNDVILANQELGKIYIQFCISRNEYLKAKDIIVAQLEWRSDPDLLLMLGDVYKKLNNISKAEDCYLKAFYIAPNRLRPIYLLVLLYYENDLIEEAKKTAVLFLNKQAKTPSADAYLMGEEIKFLLNQRRGNKK